MLSMAQALFHLILILSAVEVIADSAKRPNIVVILADDMGYADAGCTGAKDIQTPNIDQLAASGVLCTSGYCNHPFCAPSRAALLAGRYQHRFGFEDNPHYDPGNPYLGIDPEEKLFPARLQEVGYVTGGVGKWHLGAASQFHPNNRGFDYFFGFLGGGHDYFRVDGRKPLGNAYLAPLIRNGQPASFEGYLTTALSQDAAGFIVDNKEQPFFLFLSYNAPHGPLQAPQEAVIKYSSVKDRKRRIYAAMVDVMDQGVGLILETLRKHELRNNTLIFFLSDNGGPQPTYWNENFGNGSSNTPYRGGKTNLYDGGIRVPFIVSWPQTLPAGIKYDKPVISLDIGRTAVEQAGGDASSKQEMEGVDLIPHLTGANLDPPNETLFWRDRNGSRLAVLSSDQHKYVIDRIHGAPELFDLSEDVGEEHSLVSSRAPIANKLRQKWDAWNASNVPNQIMATAAYRKLQEKFYQQSFPSTEQSANYRPGEAPVSEISDR